DQIGSRWRTINRPVIPFLHESRKIAGMVDVGMANNNRIDGGRIYGKLLPVSQSELFEALKQATIKKQAKVADVEKESRTRNGAGATQKFYPDVHVTRIRKRFLIKISFSIDAAQDACWSGGVPLNDKPLRYEKSAHSLRLFRTRDQRVQVGS